jgi:hypothetical protein
MNDDTREFCPARAFREGDASTLYWIKDRKLYYRYYPLKGADIDSFRFYSGSFAKDKKNCYCCHSRLAGGNGAAFRALNFSYATDGKFVWTLGGKIKGADAASFSVCDEGSIQLTRFVRVPHGFARDKVRVFYYDYNGTANWVRKASPLTFQSLNDGYFGRDELFIFFGRAALPGAKVNHWQKLGGLYSRDDSRVYYANLEIKEADPASFQVVLAENVMLARDHRNYFHNNRAIDQSQFESLLKESF